MSVTMTMHLWTLAPIMALWDTTDPAARPRRRSFTAEYKAQILEEYDSLPTGSEGVERCCGGRACTAHTSPSGVVHATPVLVPACRKSKTGRSADQIELENLRRRNQRRSRPNSTAPRQRWRSWEKHTRSWKCSPRARTPTRSPSRDRGALRELEEATSTSGHASCWAHRVPRCYRRGIRHRRPTPRPRPAPPNALSEAERQHILSVLRSAEYCDLAPAQVWARLLDDGTYLCSIRTMYRILASPARTASDAASAPTRRRRNPS